MGAGRRPDDLSIARVARETWRLFRVDLRGLLLLAALLEVPLVLLELGLHVTPGLRSLADHEALQPALALAIIYGSLSHHFLAGLLERVVAADRHGHLRPPLREVVRHLPWHRLVIADLLLTTLIAVGLLALVAPGLLVATWLALALPLINLEGATVLGSFRRSCELVRGNAWRVGAIAIGTFAVPELALAGVAVLTHTGSAPVDGLVHALVATVLLPLSALPIVLATFDLVAIDREASADAARPGSH